jgi:hypothetical protein
MSRRKSLKNMAIVNNKKKKPHPNGATLRSSRPGRGAHGLNAALKS